MNAKEIITEYLKNNGYGGLCDFEGREGCACELDDLVCCAEAFDNCEPCYKVPAHCYDCKNDCECKGETEWCFTLEKPEEARKIKEVVVEQPTTATIQNG